MIDSQELREEQAQRGEAPPSKPASEAPSKPATTGDWSWTDERAADLEFDRKMRPERYTQEESRTAPRTPRLAIPSSWPQDLSLGEMISVLDEAGFLIFTFDQEEEE